jgi:hypothetical protein
VSRGRGPWRRRNGGRKPQGKEEEVGRDGAALFEIDPMAPGTNAVARPDWGRSPGEVLSAARVDPRVDRRGGKWMSTHRTGRAHGRPTMPTSDLIPNPGGAVEGDRLSVAGVGTGLLQAVGRRARRGTGEPREGGLSADGGGMRAAGGEKRGKVVTEVRRLSGSRPTGIGAPRRLVGGGAGARRENLCAFFN